MAATTGSNTSNPAGSPKVTPLAPVPPGPPAPDVAAKQDPSHSKADFARDLDKATRRTGDRP